VRRCDSADALWPRQASIISVLHGPRCSIRKFEPTSSVLIPPARPQHAVKRLATGILMMGLSESSHNGGGWPVAGLGR
jgi:hypothetical protein